MSFVHLHVHTEYSILDGATKISKLVDKAIADGMPAVAITDHGSMFGIKEFLDYVNKKNAGVEDETKQLKPIVGCEVYVASGSRFDKNGKEDASGDHLVLLAKNKTGYYNLVKLVSLGHLEGFYYKPRIDKEILEKYHEGLIASSACLGGEIPQYIMKNDFEGAEKSIQWFKNLFGDDYYLELQRHRATDPTAEQGTYPQQQIVNAKLLELGQKMGVKVIASNDVHFLNESDALAHDRLLCVSTNADVNDVKRMRYTRQEWFKTTAEMQELFADLPETLTNTLEVADKVEIYNINSKALMPNFPLPEGFANDGEYLRHIAYHGIPESGVPGAYKRYPELTAELKERIDFELNTMINMGFPGYFLIVQDFIAEGRKMGVSVGPGRGSAAGSVVAYCLRITDIDPLKYDLLFERFLNPDRISMPDIDIDFDDEGRGKVLQYVTDKYGKEKVAHIITFGTMATKSAIKDVARVQQLPLSESIRLANLVDKLPKEEKVSVKNAVEKVPELRAAAESPDPITRDTLKYAQMLEGTVRNVGVHACGIIIGADDLTNIVPISTADDKETKEKMAVTQYDGYQVEDVGLIKMDFLGLKTLSILKEAIVNIKQNRGVDVDLDSIPIDDKATYELYSRGDTVGTFQFESEGMRKYLRDLQPAQFEDLIAMNALYRPGPMDYIPDFIERKHGRKKVAYDIPIMEEYLKETYGVTVYQEQVMLLSRLLAGFTRGKSDELRKAMGKKIREKLDSLKPEFINGCMERGHDPKTCEKIWSDWEAFASYAFNKSHATCYSWISYQTAYLKANYPAEYMAGLLSCNLSNIDEISKFMSESRRMGIEVLSPDVNESNLSFAVNKQGNVRFGLGGVKGVSQNAVLNLVEERSKNGAFKSIHDFVERINLQMANKKTLEALAGSGAFDAFGIPRMAYFVEGKDGASYIEMLLRYGMLFQQSKNSAQQSLFGGSNDINVVQRPEPPHLTAELNELEMLRREKDLIGIYLTAHPLDEYKLIAQNMTTHTLAELSDLTALEGKGVTVLGMVTKAEERATKTGNMFGKMTLEDYSGSHELAMFGKDYIDYGKYFKVGCSLLIRGTVKERTFGYNKGNQAQAAKPKELEYKVGSIQLLSDVKKDIKSLTISLNIDEVSEAFMVQLLDIVKQASGKAKFAVNLTDPKSKVHSNLFSRKFRVEVNTKLEEFLIDNAVEFSVA